MNTVPASILPPTPRATPSGVQPGHPGSSAFGARAPLRLVVDRQPTLSRPPRPYGLEGRRHLAGALPLAESAQAPSAPAEEQGHKTMAPRRPERVAEPLAFALVLLVSVAACVVAMRG